MKKGKFLFSFTGVVLLCLVVGLGLFLYCDSGPNDESKPLRTEIVTIRVEGKKDKEVIVVEPPIVDVNHGDSIVWELHENEDSVKSFVVFFGYDSPIGEGRMKILSELHSGPENRISPKKIYHDPAYAGGRHTKYYIAVYYQKDTDPVGKVLILDPEIIIPRRGN